MAQGRLKRSDSITKRIDIKQLTLKTFGEIIEQLKDPKSEIRLDRETRVVILTSLGFIYGDIEKIVPDQEVQSDLTRTKNEVFNARDTLIAEREDILGDKSFMVNNSATLTICNATVQPFNSPETSYSYPVLFLFADQILGFTYDRAK